MGRQAAMGKIRMSTTGRPPVRLPQQVQRLVAPDIMITMTAPGPQPGGRRQQSTGSARSSEGGFTLLELMAVMALLALLVGLVLPGLLRSWERAGSRANLRKLTSALRLARSEAATQGHRVRLFLDLKDGRFQVEGTNQRGALTGMRLTDAHLVWEDQGKRQGYIAFYGDGSSSGGKVVLEESTGQRHLIEVQPITGKVELAIQEK
jgi:general secretion pathway protein H